MPVEYPKISIVTPSYNQGKFIEETILSVLNQNYPNLEYIIIDGGSNDNTVEILKKYSDKLKFWVSEKDEGQSHAINKGIKHCTGAIFNWLNSDDLLRPNSLFLIAEAFLKDEDVYMVSGKECFFEPNGNREIKMGTLLYPKIEHTLFYSTFYQPSTYWRLDKFKALGELNQKIHFLMDTDQFVKYLFMFGQKNIVKINEVLVDFRLHDSSKSIALGHKFSLDRNSIWSAVFKGIHLEDFLIKRLNNKTKDLELHYISKVELDKLEMKYLLARYFLILNYKERKFKDAKSCLSLILKKYFWKDYQLKVYFFVRLFLVPDFVFLKIKNNK